MAVTPGRIGRNVQGIAAFWIVEKILNKNSKCHWALACLWRPFDGRLNVTAW
jgi:hypothetical protein